MKRTICILFLIILFFGFSVNKIEASSIVELEDYNLHMVTEREDDISVDKDNIYEDENIKIKFWIASWDSMGVELKNKLDKPIKVIWDDVTLIDHEGNSTGVIKSNIRYANKMNSIKPSTIPKEASLSDRIIPVSNVYYSDGWTIKPLFPRTTAETEYRVFFPIKIDNKIKNYDFTLKYILEPSISELRKEEMNLYRTGLITLGILLLLGHISN